MIIDKKILFYCIYLRNFIIFPNYFIFIPKIHQKVFSLTEKYFDRCSKQVKYIANLVKLTLGEHNTKISNK